MSSDKGAIPEVVKDCFNGFIVNPKDINVLAERVLMLVRNPALRLSMGRKGRALFEKEFSIYAYEKRVENIVKRFGKLQRRC